MPLASLRDAEARLARGEHVAALEALLRAWRAARAPAIAQAIERLGAQIDALLPPVRGKTRAALQEAWVDTCDAGQARDVGRLLACLFDGQSPTVAVRVAELARRPADPRIGARLAAAVIDPPWTAGPSRKAWRAIFQLLAETRDPRARSVLAGWPPEGRAFSVTFQRDHDKGIAEVLAALEPEPLLDDACLELVAAIARAPAPASLEEPAQPRQENELELLAGIAAAPGDDAARHVYADFLHERGDPRAELFALQLRDKPLGAGEKKRAAALARRLAPKLVGPLAPVLEARSLRFERGMLAACATRFRTAKQRRELVGHPLWATVEDLTTDEPAVATHEVMRSLRVLRTTTVEALVAVAASPRPLAIREAWLDLPAGPLAPDAAAAIGEARALPALEHLGFRLHGLAFHRQPIGAAMFAWLLRSPLAARLRRLTLAEQLGAHGIHLESWLEALGPLHVDLLLGGAGLCDLHRGERGARFSVRADAFPAGLAAALRHVEPALVEHITVLAPESRSAGEALDETRRASFAALLARFPHSLY
jgi:uncharacterized protein (TIGR02996 family)